MARTSEHPLLKLYGLKTCDTRGDGNCLFNALSDQIFGDQSKHHEIRAEVIKHMRDNADDYKPFVPVERGGGQRRNPKRKNAGAYSTPFNNEPATLEEIDRNFEVHLERMAKGGTYGDNLEIRAFSRAYNTDVKIYNYDNAYYVRAADDGAVRPIAHIAYHTWEHYSSIRNINGPFTGLPDIQAKDPSPEEAAKVKAETPKGVIIHEWMMKSVSSSLPHLAFDQETIRRTLEEHSGRVNDAVDQLLGAEYSTPGTPGSLSQSGSSSIERDPDSDDDEIYGPNKRQNRRMSRATKALRKEQEKRERREADLQAIPTIELTQPDAVVTTELPIQSHETAIKPATHKTKQDDGDDEFIAASDDEADDDVRPDVDDNDEASEYSTTSVSQSTEPPSTSQRPQQRVILHTKSMQKQFGPQRKRITTAQRKELKKAAQKQARKESRRNNSQRQLATSTININVKRDSPPMDQVIGMKTLYI